MRRCQGPRWRGVGEGVEIEELELEGSPVLGGQERGTFHPPAPGWNQFER